MKKVVLTTIAVVIAAVAAQAQSVRADVGMMAYMMPTKKTQETKLDAAVERQVAQSVKNTQKLPAQRVANQAQAPAKAAPKQAQPKAATACKATKTAKSTTNSREDLRLAVMSTAAGQPFK